MHDDTGQSSDVQRSSSEDLGGIGKSGCATAEGLPHSSASAGALGDELCPSEIEGLPALRVWKTSVVFSILGFLAILLLSVVVSLPITIALELHMGAAAVALPYPVTTIAGPLSGMVSAVLTTVYALAVYPSYFRRKPLLKSSRAISFFNLLFGGLIFGCLWNGNLTRSKILERPKKGTSYIVASVLSIITLCLLWFTFSTTKLPMMEYARAHYGQAPSRSEYVQSDEGSAGSRSASGTVAARAFRDPETGVSFTFPIDWGKASDESEVQGVSCVLTPYDGDGALMYFGAVDEYAIVADEGETLAESGVSREELDMAFLDEATALARVELGMDAVQSENAELVTIGDRDYWRATASGTVSDGEQSGDVGVMRTEYIRMENGFSYRFGLLSFGSSAERNEEMNADLLELMNSVGYPE